jgi:transcriptional regulator with XRE-family HTH domain
MLLVETVAKVRRLRFVQGLAIKAICRELGLSRKVMRKVLRSRATAFRYERTRQPMPRLGAWQTDLDRLLEENAGRPSG